LPDGCGDDGLAPCLDQHATVRQVGVGQSFSAAAPNIRGASEPSQRSNRAGSGTITTGGAAQNAISTPGVNGIHGFMACNLSTTEPLWLNPNGTAAAATPGSIPLRAATTGYAGAGGCYQSGVTWSSNNPGLRRDDRSRVDLLDLVSEHAVA
jgi:hypothetical protein